MVRKLFEPERYPKSKSRDLYKTSLNHLVRNGSKAGLCALGFEPNPKYYKRLQEMETNYTKKGWKVHFFPFAIFDRDETVSFYTEKDAKDKDGSAGVYKRHDQMKQNYTVQGIRFASFVPTVLKGK